MAIMFKNTNFRTEPIKMRIKKGIVKVKPSNKLNNPSIPVLVFNFENYFYCIKLLNSHFRSDHV